jgi:KaiC/GvpD/RAD55 family RecA-like ATPase
MKVMVTAEVQYCCELSEEDSQKVIKYAKEYNCDYENAVEKLYWSFHDIDLYRTSYESDFSTESIDEVELDEEEEEEID